MVLRPLLGVSVQGQRQCVVGWFECVGGWVGSDGRAMQANTSLTFSSGQRALAGQRVTVFELDDGTVQVRHAGKVLPTTQIGKEDEDVRAKSTEESHTTYKRRLIMRTCRC